MRNYVSWFELSGMLLAMTGVFTALVGWQDYLTPFIAIGISCLLMGVIKGISWTE